MRSVCEDWETEVIDEFSLSVASSGSRRGGSVAGRGTDGRDDFMLRGIGYNGFPRGCSDDKLPWAKLNFLDYANYGAFSLQQMSFNGDQLETKYP
ncbi:hypothetical protein KSP40_PGU019180 [Platanthera guangdongensis]|uniref:Uncharacterized protein n=1 Tax=Platanthera guangdongensis TaxID=2320717 RepID=A0ABR2MFX5_9ASPA